MKWNKKKEKKRTKNVTKQKIERSLFVHSLCYEIATGALNALTRSLARALISRNFLVRSIISLSILGNLLFCSLARSIALTLGTSGRALISEIFERACRPLTSRHASLTTHYLLHEFFCTPFSSSFSSFSTSLSFFFFFFFFFLKLPYLISF